MKRSLLLVALFAFAPAACGPGPEEEELFNLDPGIVAEIEEVGEPAEDLLVGEEEFGDPDPLAELDVCAGQEDCDGALIEDNDLASPIDEADLEEDEAQTSQALTTPRPVVGSRMIVASYAPFRRSASGSAPTINVTPAGVRADSLHPSRNPKGLIPPGQTVTLISTEVINNFMHVRYANTSGWVHKPRLVWLDPNVSRLTLAKRAGARNAFFKHQIRRTKWNKDGPLTSGNCAPTSLAMAALVWGAEPAGLSVEQSIHRIRSKYDPGLHERTGTFRSEIDSAARKIGLKVASLRTDVPPATGLRRLRNQLDAGRVVVLMGMPGKRGDGPTLYERAFTRAYQAAIRDGATLRHSSYNFDGGHSILVLGRDSRGRYIVGDPISEVGFITLSATEMQDYITRFTRNRGTGTAVWK